MGLVNGYYIRLILCYAFCYVFVRHVSAVRYAVCYAIRYAIFAVFHCPDNIFDLVVPVAVTVGFADFF